MNLLVNDRQFRIEFRHISKLGKRAQLHRGTVQAVTTCVVIETGSQAAMPFIAIDNALCVVGDTFSRREGRLRSLNKVLDHCAPLRAMKSNFLVAYLERDPAPRQTPAAPKPKLSSHAIQQLRDNGQADKAERRLLRKYSRFRQKPGSAAAMKLVPQMESFAKRLLGSAETGRPA